MTANLVQTLVFSFVKSMKYSYKKLNSAQFPLKRKEHLDKLLKLLKTHYRIVFTFLAISWYISATAFPGNIACELHTNTISIKKNWKYKYKGIGDYPGKGRTTSSNVYIPFNKSPESTI